MPSKITLVTGATGHLGKSVTSQLLSDGHFVLGTARTSEDWQELQAHPNFEGYQVDVTRENEVHSLVDYLNQSKGQIDFAVLLVGGFSMGTLENTSLNDVQKMYQLNFETAYLCSQKLYSRMLQQKNGGHIVLVGARPALEASAGASMIAYALSKSLLFHLSDLINAKTADTGVRCSIIVPSVLDTPPNRDSMPDANFEDWVTPEEVARAISFLASDVSKSLRQTVIKLYGNA